MTMDIDSESQYPCHGGPFKIKVYVVLQRRFSRDPDRPNVRVIAVKLTQAAAQGVVNAIPGTWWVRRVANKYPTI